MDIRQIIPKGFCKACDICCRFPEATSELRPTFLNKEITERDFFSILDNIRPSKITLKKYKDFYICRYFDPEKNICTTYDRRPFDCRLYPFMIMYNSDYSSVGLFKDTKCPFIRENEALNSYEKDLIEFLDKNDSAQVIYKNFSFINNYQPDAVFYGNLPKINKLIFKGDFEFKKLSLNDRALFKSYFEKAAHSGLSAYSFEYLFAFSDIINTLWKVIDESLFVFYDTGDDFFMPIIPVMPGNRSIDEKTMSFGIELMSKISKNPPRIENIPKECVPIFKNMDFKIKKSEDEFILSCKSASELKGDVFKSKRALYNHFVKNTSYKFKDFDDSVMAECLNLYKIWEKGGIKKYGVDSFFKNLAEDGMLMHKKILENYNNLGLKGAFLEVGGNIAAYTVGFPLDKETFVVLLEITDQQYKGISEFISAEFAKLLKDFTYINIMGDSGLSNLKKTKMSYHPVKTIPVFSAEKKII